MRGFPDEDNDFSLDEAVAVIEAEKEEVDPIVGQIVTDQTVVAVTTNQQANQGKRSSDRDCRKIVANGIADSLF